MDIIKNLENEARQEYTNDVVSNPESIQGNDEG
jgi:hypothetical protein